MVKRKHKWQDWIDEKADIVAAGIKRIIPLDLVIEIAGFNHRREYYAESTSSGLEWRQSEHPDSATLLNAALMTHAILETKVDIAEPQIIGIFINDSYQKGLRYILAQDKLYKLIDRINGMVKMPEVWTGTICLVKEENQKDRDYITNLVEKVGVHKILNNGQVIEISTHAIVGR
jgi:hypothetical protein